MWLIWKCVVLFSVFWFSKNLNNLYLFVPANEFPSSFESIVRKILRLLFHVVAHLYHCHFREVLLLNLHAHLNCVFVHLTLFNERFRLIEPRETEILDDLVVALKILVTEPSETEQVGLDKTIDIRQTKEHSMKNNWVCSPLAAIIMKEGDTLSLPISVHLLAEPVTQHFVSGLYIVCCIAYCISCYFNSRYSKNIDNTLF